MVGGGMVCTLQGLYSLSVPYCGRGVVREAKRVQFPPCVAQSNARGGTGAWSRSVALRYAFYPTAEAVTRALVQGGRELLGCALRAL